MSENESKDFFSENETRKHILLVVSFLNMCSSELLKRGSLHDGSKLEEPERAVFEKYTPLLSDVAFGSEKYKKYTDEMKPALNHHYSKNKHHPEFWFYKRKDGSVMNDPILSMDLIDITEMLCDWLAASRRHEDGDIQKSITHCGKRFNISKQLESLLRNTAKALEEWEKRVE